MAPSARMGSSPPWSSRRARNPDPSAEMRDVAPDLDDLRALAARLAELCGTTQRRVATAESCTGGLVGHVCTEIPGSSAWFLGGVIAYANEVKSEVLGVP